MDVLHRIPVRTLQAAGRPLDSPETAVTASAQDARLGGKVGGEQCRVIVIAGIREVRFAACRCGIGQDVWARFKVRCRLRCGEVDFS